MAKSNIVLQVAVAAVSLALAIYLSTYLSKTSSTLMCSTGIPCPQDCGKCPTSA